MHQISRSIKGRLAVIILLLLSSTWSSPIRAEEDGEDEGYIPGEVIVKLVLASDLPAVAADYNLDPAPLGQFGARPIYRLRILDGGEPPVLAERLRGDARVVYADPNYLTQTPESRQRSGWAIGGETGEYIGQWAPATIQLARAHTLTRGAGVRVAVLDTGVDPSHLALAGRLDRGYDFVDDDDDPSEVGQAGDAYGHGTHVAGIVALAAPQARIMPVRMLDRNGNGNIWVVAEALGYAIDPDGNPSTDDGAQVVNMSFGTRREAELLDDLAEDLICEAEEDSEDEGDEECLAGPRGVVLVAAAGNSGGTVREYPAAADETGVLAVAASTSGDALASFSTRGPWVQIAAPGEDILSSVPGGGYGTWSGTSMAAPFVAGTAALVRAANPGLNARAAADLIRASAAPIGTGLPPRIDAAAALGAPATASHRVFLPMAMR